MSVSVSESITFCIEIYIDDKEKMKNDGKLSLDMFSFKNHREIKKQIK